MFWTLKLNFCNLFISKHYITGKKSMFGFLVEQVANQN